MSGLNVEEAVRARYSGAAQERENALCCPVDYDVSFLKVIPEEVIERDYGCGDPSAYVGEGETVLDLGSGGGKICFIASQKVGPKGRVIGVDMNDEMLELARRSASVVGEKIGYENCTFFKGKIQDLKLDRDLVASYLKERPVTSEQDFQELERHMQDLRRTKPMVADDSIDVVVSNCVLNLVENAQKKVLFEELYRVLKRGGRAVISDIVADEDIPEALQNDPELWSGCLSGAYQESAFLRAFEDAGFYGVQVVKRDEKPWRVVEGIEFRSVTVIAYKGKDGPCFEHNEALIYKGPFSRVTDDDGHTFVRGERTAVCRKTFEIFSRAPYKDDFYHVNPRVPIAPEDAKPFACQAGTMIRSAKVTKGEDYSETTSACEPGSCC